MIGVPDSGLDAALGFSRASGIPYGIGLIKNKYVGRTFIAPDHRLDQVKIKLSAIRDVVRGKRVVLIGLLSFCGRQARKKSICVYPPRLFFIPAITARILIRGSI